MTKALDLKQLVEQLPVMASEHGLVLVPAVPEGHSGRVDLEQEKVTVQQFCALAAAAGSKVLFHEVTDFDTEGFMNGLDPVTDDELLELNEAPVAAPIPPEVVSLRRRAQHRQGQVEHIELCVITDGVAVHWSCQADWALGLQGDFDDLAQQLSEAAQGDEERIEHDTQAEADRLAQILEDDPAFRAATTPQARRRIADRAADRACPIPKAERGPVVWRALEQAVATVENTSEEVYGGLTTRLDQLADELLATGRLHDARTLRTREIHLKEFLRERSGGYAPPRDLVALMLELPQLRRPAIGRQSGDPLFT